MSAVATSRNGILKYVSRWSQPGRGDARPDGDPAALSTAQSSPNGIVIGPKKSPRPTSGRHHLTAALTSPASTINAAIKSP